MKPIEKKCFLCPQNKFGKCLVHPPSPPPPLTQRLKLFTGGRRIEQLKTASRYNLRSSTELLLEKPGTTTLTTLGDRSFEMAAPTLWNSLPAEIRNACNVATFKKMLKTHFFMKSFSSVLS